ncbi:RAMP superfamily CRISPR-associated protein [Sulfuracidifex tepidarius]|nr:RAMP superfamily CRISPR-associated protein [Sulfuracidifex tepidarius]
MLSSIPPQKLKEIIGIEKAVGKEEEIIELQKEKDTNSLLVEVEKSINGDKDAKLGVIDLLFGSHFFASPLLFTDAQVDNGAVKSRFHVSIDLDREVAKTGALVELEAVEPGSKFIGKMIYNSIDTGNSSQIDRAFEILKSTLNKTEIFIGGWRSRGYGLCEFSIINSKKYTPIDLISEKK